MFIGRDAHQQQAGPQHHPVQPQRAAQDDESEPQNGDRPYRLGSTKEHRAVSATMMTIGAPISPPEPPIPQ